MGEQDIVGQILSVSGRPTKNGKTIYDIAFSDGNKYTTFNGGIAEKANSLIGQSVSARVKVEQKGQYTNYYFNDVAPQGQLPAQPVVGGTVIPMQQSAVSGSIPMQTVQGDPAKDAKIAKAVSVKAAVELTSALFTGAGPESLQEALDSIEGAAKHIYGVLTGAPQLQDQITPVAATPEAVAAVVNEQAGQEVVAAGATVPWQ